VGWGDSGGLDSTDLRIPLALDFLEFQATAGDAKKEALGAAFELAFAIEEATDLIGRSGRGAIAQIEMNTDAKFGVGASHIDGGSKSAAVGEQGSASDQAFAVAIGDAPIDAFGPAEVVGVDDEVLHALLLYSLRDKILLSAGTATLSIVGGRRTIDRATL
jgi:hypothetical protein